MTETEQFAQIKELQNSIKQIEKQLEELTEIAALKERILQLENQLESSLILLSDVYRYGKLKDLLAAKKWQEADQETTKIMLILAGENSQENVTPEDLEKIPCDAINVIDQLWLKYSDSKFGFFVQLEIYQSLGGSMEAIMTQDMSILQAVMDQTGWRKNDQRVDYENFDFQGEMKKGALP